MPDENKKPAEKLSGKQISAQIGIKERRKLKARMEKNRGVWFGLGMFGLVGWSVAIPALMAVALGVWLDEKLDDPYSWTLMMIFIGIGIGCLNAWYWVKKENERE